MLFKQSPKQEVLPELKPLLKKANQKKEKRKANRRSVIIWLILSVAASLFFYFKTEAPRFWEKVTSPLVITSSPQGKKESDSSAVLEEIQGLLRKQDGTWGIYVLRLDTGQSYGLKEKEVFPAPTLMKLAVMATLYRQAEKGETNLESKYVLTDQDKIGVGPLQKEKSGTVYTYRQLAGYIGKYSDDTAVGVLKRILGDGVIQLTIDDLGMADTSLKKNETTPSDIGLLFQALFKGEGISSKNQEELWPFLTKTSSEDRIPAGVPEDIQVVHMTGTESGSLSDAGIVLAPKPFILVIMAEGEKELEAKPIFTAITRAVWEFERNLELSQSYP